MGHPSMMSNSMRFVWFDEQLIGLDIDRSVYTILSSSHSKRLSSRTHEVPIRQGGRRLRGVSQNFWTLSRCDVSFDVDAVLLGTAFVALCRAHRSARRQRMAGIQQLIERERQQLRGYTTFPAESLTKALNAACLIYWKKTKCLEWSCALVLIGFRFGFDFRLVVGVQNCPFYAHAWVENSGKIIGDDIHLRERLAVIWEIN
jgi:hypothetical protein